MTYLIYTVLSVLVMFHLPNAEEARWYSPERLVEKTPESSVHRTNGCFALYSSAASPCHKNTCFKSQYIAEGEICCNPWRVAD